MVVVVGMPVHKVIISVLGRGKDTPVADLHDLVHARAHLRAQTSLYKDSMKTFDNHSMTVIV